MSGVPISEARDHLGDLGNRVALRGERVIVERRGKDLFAMVPVEDMKLLERLEDQIDLQTIRERMDEPSTPWRRVKKEFGL